MNIDSEKKFFIPIKEARNNYFVVYSPPLHEYRFASLSVTFTESTSEEVAANVVEKEIDIWLKKYPIPIMASAFDEAGDLYYLEGVRPESHIIGFIRSDGTIEKHWRILKDEEIPAVALNREYILEIYKDLHKKTSSQIREEREKMIKGRRLLWRVMFFGFVVVPAGVAIVEFYSPQWLAALVMGYSLIKTTIKALRMLGKISKSPAEAKKEEEERLMKHHHYHCKINPEGFLRLKVENFEKSAREEVKKEFLLLKERTK